MHDNLEAMHAGWKSWLTFAGAVKCHHVTWHCKPPRRKVFAFSTGQVLQLLSSGCTSWEPSLWGWNSALIGSRLHWHTLVFILRSWGPLFSVISPKDNAMNLKPLYTIHANHSFSWVHTIKGNLWEWLSSTKKPWLKEFFFFFQSVWNAFLSPSWQYDMTVFWRGNKTESDLFALAGIPRRSVTIMSWLVFVNCVVDLAAVFFTLKILHWAQLLPAIKVSCKLPPAAKGGTQIHF